MDEASSTRETTILQLKLSNPRSTWLHGKSLAGYPANWMSAGSLAQFDAVQFESSETDRQHAFSLKLGL